MAEEEAQCTSVEFEEDGITNVYTTCWNYSVPDPGWDASVVQGALSRPIKKGSRAWRTCKYFVSGMPAVCQHFNVVDQICQFKSEEKTLSGAEKRPSGYNQGLCDGLGRQSSCDQYSSITGTGLRKAMYLVRADKIVSYVTAVDGKRLYDEMERLKGVE